MKARLIATVILRILTGWACLLLLVALILYYGTGVKGGSLYTATGGHTSFSDCLYFAIVTGTTVGYGDYFPLGWFRIVAVLDAFGGIAMAGLLVANLTSELFDPLMAVRGVEGMWFKGGEIGQAARSASRPLFTIFTISRIGRDWLCDGRNFDAQGKYKHSFEGKVIALEKHTIYVTYQNDATATKDFTSGVWVLHLTNGPDDSIAYNGYSFDHVHGRHDVSAGFRLDKKKDGALIRGLRTRESSEAFSKAFSEALSRL